MENLSSQVNALIDSQIHSWELARRNYAALARIETRPIAFDGFSMQVQFNPERVASTTARVDDQAQAQTSCFLCREKRPPEQQGIPWGDYELLVNPYPIFARHLTIPHQRHTPQRITGHFADLLALARDLDEFVITFNGAKSGASIPSHLHFQAVGKGNLPLEKDTEVWPQKEPLHSSETTRIYSLENYLRPTILLEGNDPEAVARSGERYLQCLSTGPEEAELNALAWSTPHGYRLALLPRTARRPWQYQAEGDEQVFFSPGAVDIAGVVITVRETDYRKMSAELLTNMFQQVVPDPEQWNALKSQLQRCF